MNTSDAKRRLEPRIIDTDWLLLRGLTKSLRTTFSQNINKNARVLDFGCGTMPYRNLVLAHHGIYIGADYGQNSDVEINMKGVLQREDSSVDVILSVQVLEHVRDLDLYFSEATRVLTPKGKLILSTHGTWLYHPHPEDHRRWTRPGLKNEIETRGFKVEHCEAIVGPLAWTTILRLTGFVFFLKNIPIIGNILTSIISIIMNIRSYIEDAITPQSIRDDNACVYLIIAHKSETTK